VSPAKKKPSSIADVLAGVLQDTGIAARVEQAGIIPEWSALVGSQIASVTEPMSITADGTLFVNVTTNAWMNELSLMEPELLRALNVKPERPPVRKIRYQLKREAAP
jgi:predicted nucleic acid-binding Zn ribbon protein